MVAGKLACHERRRARDPRRCRSTARASLARGESRLVGVAGRRDRGERPATRAGRARLVGRARRSPALRRPSSEPAGRAANGSDGRRLDLLHDLMLSHQLPDDLRARIVELESSVDLRFSRHRGVVRRQSRSTTPRSSGSSAGATIPPSASEAWEASKTVGAEVAEDVRELARLRNEAARGARPPRLVRALARDRRARRGQARRHAAARPSGSRPRRSRAGRRGSTRRSQPVSAARSSELRPWHYADPFFQEAPPDGAVDLDRAVRGAGRRRALAPHVRRSRLRRRRDPRSGAISSRATARTSTPSASTSTVDGDVRILANLVATHDSTDTMLHELGHGVYDLGLRDDLPWLLRSTHLVATEASALLFGALARRREWLELVLGLSAAEGADLGRSAPRRARRRAARVHALGARR